MFDFNKENGEILIYDEIGPDWYGMIDASAVITALSQMDGKRVTVRINSPGGSVDEGVAIYNALERYPGGVDTVNDSVAASIANYIFMVGENRHQAKNAKSMIHKPWSLAFGNAEEFRKQAEILDKYDDSIAAVYIEKTEMTAEDVSSAMGAETWYLAEEAVAAGLATGVGLAVETEPATIAAGRYKNTPQDLLIKPKAGSLRKIPHNRIAAEIRQKRHKK